MRRQLSTVLGRLAAGKRENGQNGRKLHLGRTLLLGIGGATAGGFLWQYHQTGDILLKVRIKTIIGDKSSDKIADR